MRGCFDSGSFDLTDALARDIPAFSDGFQGLAGSRRAESEAQDEYFAAALGYAGKQLLDER